MTSFASLSSKQIKGIALACDASIVGLSEKTEFLQLVVSVAAERRFTCEQYLACNSVLANKESTNPLNILMIDSKEQAKSSFRRLSLLLHPDKVRFRRSWF